MRNTGDICEELEGLKETVKKRDILKLYPSKLKGLLNFPGKVREEFIY